MSVESLESANAATLRPFAILDSPPEQVFDSLAQLAASTCATPVASISFIDGPRIWSSATAGVPRAGTPLDPETSVCAGVPLVAVEGHVLGMLSVLDYVPRVLTHNQLEALREIAQHVVAQLELRRRVLHFKRTNAARRDNVVAISRALDERQFALHYQPTIDVRTGHIVALEALIRWQHPVRGLVAPREFMPLLEDSGLIVEVGSWVIRQAARDYHRWLANGVSAPRLSVNISLTQFRHPRFVEDLELALDPDGMSRAPLDIEISGELLLDSSETTLERLRHIQNLGVQITLDDFGAGSAAARLLARLPIDTVKIDRSLIATMTRGPDDMSLVANLISLAHGLGLQIIATGVETEEQRKLLRLLRCEQMQGFFFAQPRDAVEVEQVLRRDQSQAAAEWALVLEELP